MYTRWSLVQNNGRLWRGLHVVLLLVGTVLVGGCAFVRASVGESFKDDEVAAIKKGTTTRMDVASQFGAPDEIIEANGHDIFHYRRWDTKMGYLLIFSRVNVAMDHLYVVFTREGIVDDVFYGKRSDGLRFQVWPFGE